MVRIKIIGGLDSLSLQEFGWCKSWVVAVHHDMYGYGNLRVLASFLTFEYAIAWLLYYTTVLSNNGWLSEHGRVLVETPSIPLGCFGEVGSCDRPPIAQISSPAGSGGLTNQQPTCH